MLKKFKPNSINIVATIVTLGIIYFLEIAFSCTGLYHMIDGAPTAPFSASEIPLKCIGNHIARNLWIYPIAAITSYAIISLLMGHKKLNITTMQTNKSENISNTSGPSPFAQTFFHGTKADLKLGDFIEIGLNSNYGQKKQAKYIYLTATLDAAIWGAELALGEGQERIYLVEPTGTIEDDPNLTDKKFPGNPTKSYRSKHPFKVVGEITIWQKHPLEQVKVMTDHIKQLKEQGIEAIED